NSYTWSTQNQMDFAPSMTQIHGRHVLHFGLEFVYAALGNGGPGRANGEFSFTRQWTQQFASRNRGPLDGNGVADLLLGLPYTGGVDYNDSFYRTWPYYAGFVQDNWKIRPNLTLNLGLRYDIQVPFVERDNRVNAGFDLTAKNPLSDAVLAKWAELKTAYDAGNPKYPYPDPPAALYGGRLFATPHNRRPYDTDWTNVQPRLGVAWNFAHQTVLRAGFGIYHRTAPDLNFADGFSQRTSYQNSLNGGLTPSAGLAGPYSLENPFPDGIVAPTGSALGLLTNVGRATSFDGRERPIPRTYQYSIGVQRELPWQMLLDVSYSGSQTVHDMLPVQLDAVDTGQFLKGQADPFYLNRQLPSPFAGILPANSDLGGGDSVTASNLLRPYPLFNGIVMNTNPSARYRYDSLQLQLEKRVLDSTTTGIVSFLFAYTFSKSFAADHRLNDWDLQEKPVHELSPLDKPRNIAFAGTWDLPIGWGRRWLKDGNRLTGALTNGWAIDWIFTYTSGYPVDKPDANFLCGSYLAPGGQTSAHWFNNDPKCYQSRPLYTLRTAEDRFPNIRTPSAPQLNMSGEKTFWLNDRYTLQFRGEAYNLTNTPIFPGPNTNFRDPRFGQLPFQQSNFPRYVQIAAKLVF
ncbi:MAG: TonB-dependent receptor, partial [Acidobacteriota bacterium]|nr:TonB-dependent receptor [Acidobacteriota bacterium]